MKRNISLVGLLLLGGCEALHTGIIITRVAPSQGANDCTFSGTGSEAPLGLNFDAAAHKVLNLPHSWRNDLHAADIAFAGGSAARSVNITVPNQVTPVRFELQWHCDSPGFTIDQPTFIVPAFDPVKPFCVDRDAAGKIPAGFDVVDARGPPVQSGGSSGVFVSTVVSYPLGIALQETFKIGRLADECCRKSAETNNNNVCSGFSTSAIDDPCNVLQDVFSVLDSKELSVKSTSPTENSNDLTTLRPLALYHGTYQLLTHPEIWTGSAQGAVFAMTYRGTMEGITGAGDTVVSGQFIQEVGFCYECGEINGQVRAPYTNDNVSCYAQNL